MMSGIEPPDFFQKFSISILIYPGRFCKDSFPGTPIQDWGFFYGQMSNKTKETSQNSKKTGVKLMLKIMANENMDDWGVSSSVIDETVRAVKKF